MLGLGAAWVGFAGLGAARSSWSQGTREPGWCSLHPRLLEMVFVLAAFGKGGSESRGSATGGMSPSRRGASQQWDWSSRTPPAWWHLRGQVLKRFRVRTSKAPKLFC